MYLKFLTFSSPRNCFINNFGEWLNDQVHGEGVATCGLRGVVSVHTECETTSVLLVVNAAHVKSFLVLKMLVTPVLSITIIDAAEGMYKKKLTPSRAKWRLIARGSKTKSNFFCTFGLFQQGRLQKSVKKSKKEYIFSSFRCIMLSQSGRNTPMTVN